MVFAIYWTVQLSRLLKYLTFNCCHFCASRVGKKASPSD